MAFAFLVFIFLFLMFRYLKEEKARVRRIAVQQEMPREELLPRHYKSFVEIEKKLWAATEESGRAKWDTRKLKLRPPELRLVREYVEGLRKDFAQANRIFSIVIGRSPNTETLMQLERHRLKIELPYYALCTVVRLHLWMDRVSMKELRRLTDLVASIAYEVRTMLNVFEQSGRLELVETLLRKS